MRNGNSVQYVPRQNVLKLILKSPRFVPFGVNLTQFEAKSDIPGVEAVSSALVMKKRANNRGAKGDER